MNVRRSAGMCRGVQGQSRQGDTHRSCVEGGVALSNEGDTANERVGITDPRGTFICTGMEDEGTSHAVEGGGTQAALKSRAEDTREIGAVRERRSWPSSLKRSSDPSLAHRYASQRSQSVRRPIPPDGLVRGAPALRPVQLVQIRIAPIDRLPIRCLQEEQDGVDLNPIPFRMQIQIQIQAQMSRCASWSKTNLLGHAVVPSMRPQPHPKLTFLGMQWSPSMRPGLMGGVPGGEPRGGGI